MVNPTCRLCTGFGYEAGGHIPCARCDGKGFTLDDVIDIISELETRILTLEKEKGQLPTGWVVHPTEPIKQDILPAKTTVTWNDIITNETIIIYDELFPSNT